MLIKIQITKSDNKKLSKLAKENNISPEELIEQFIADLICSNNSAGNDERLLAGRWLSRSSYNW